MSALGVDATGPGALSAFSCVGGAACLPTAGREGARNAVESAAGSAPAPRRAEPRCSRASHKGRCPSTSGVQKALSPLGCSAMGCSHLTGTLFCSSSLTKVYRNF